MTAGARGIVVTAVMRLRACGVAGFGVAAWPPVWPSPCWRRRGGACGPGSGRTQPRKPATPQTDGQHIPDALLPRRRAQREGAGHTPTRP